MIALSYNIFHDLRLGGYLQRAVLTADREDLLSSSYGIETQSILQDNTLRNHSLKRVKKRR